MTKRKQKAIPKGPQPTPTTPRKGSKTKQRRVFSTETPISNEAPEALKQRKLDFALASSPEANDPAVPPVITPAEPTQSDTPKPVKANAPSSTSPKQVQVQESNTSPSPPTVLASSPSSKPTAQPPQPILFKSAKLKDCRYKITIEMLPTDDPLPTFCSGFKKVFEIIQKLCKPNPIWLAAWDPEQSSSFEPIKDPKDIPSGKKWTHRRQLSAYFGGYIDPNPKGEKMYSKLRFMTPSTSDLDLEQLGQVLRGAFYSLEPDLHVAIPQNPIPCQATRPVCIGWLFGSSKFINEKSFLPAVRACLKIPDDCRLGMQWRVIVNALGKRPIFDSDTPAPSAIHLDISDEYAPTIAARASELWCSRQSRPKSHIRLPNDIQLRLVPCFSNSLTRARSEASKSDIIQMAEKQQYFSEKVLQRVEVPFIRLLDTELSSQESITLRRIIMARAPVGFPTKRLVHNVDFNWSGNKVIITTPIRYLLETTQFANNLIPALRHDYGGGVDKWFTAAGIHLFQDQTWNPDTSTSSTRAELATKAIADEDLWEIGDAWKHHSNIASRPSVPTPAPDQVPELPIVPPIPPSGSDIFGDDSDIRSFASAFQRASNQPPVPPNATTKTSGTVQLSQDTLQALAQKPPDSESDTLSMSTAARTTDSTRLRLQTAKGTIANQAHEIAQIKQAVATKDSEIDQLRQQLQAFMRQNEMVEFVPDPPLPSTDDDDAITEATDELIARLTKPPPNSKKFPPPPTLGPKIFHQPSSVTQMEIDLTAVNDDGSAPSSASADATSSASPSSTSSSSSSSSASSTTSAHSRLATQELVDITHGDIDNSD